MRTVRTDFFYPVAPERLWRLATSYDALGRVMAGLVEFDGLPEGRTRTGQEIHVQVSLFGRLPAQPYTMEVLECDDSRMILRSSERGAGVRSWNHRMKVAPAPGGSRLSDTIEIDAGLMTWAFALWARYLYTARHKPRLRLLEDGAY